MTDKEIIIDDLNKTINRLQQECTTKGNELIILTDQLQCKEQECEELKEDKRLALQLINGLLKEFNLTNYDWAYDQNEIHTELRDMFDRYKQALEKIEEYVKSQLDANGNDVYSMDKTAIHKFLNILNEVKDV